MPADGTPAAASRNWDSALPLRQLAPTLLKDRDDGKVIQSMLNGWLAEPVGGHAVFAEDIQGGDIVAKDAIEVS